jgi:SAM-dependent methyltransferase
MMDQIAYRVASELILNGSSGYSPCAIFHSVSDDFWFWLLTEGIRRNAALRSILPGMPDEAVQFGFTGASGDTVLKEGFDAYRLFKHQYERHVGPIQDTRAVLDFGCGWGRLIRFFMKDIAPSKLCGADPVSEIIDFCKASNKWCNFYSIQPDPPSPFEDGTFDLIYGYSVFSHLNEDMQKRWLIELHRIVKPGGLVILTTRARRFIEQCATIRRQGNIEAIPLGPSSAVECFLETERHISAYDRAKYCFSPLNIPQWTYWGEAAIPKEYVLRQWTEWFEFVDFIDNPNGHLQSVVVVRKPAQH